MHFLTSGPLLKPLRTDDVLPDWTVLILPFTMQCDKPSMNTIPNLSPGKSAPTSASHYALPPMPLGTPPHLPTLSSGRLWCCLLHSGFATPGPWYVPAERIQMPRFPPVAPKWKCRPLLLRRMKIKSTQTFFEARTVSCCLHSCLAHCMLTKLLLDQMKGWENDNSGLLAPSPGLLLPLEGIFSSVLALFETILLFNHSCVLA